MARNALAAAREALTKPEKAKFVLRTVPDTERVAKARSSIKDRIVAAGRRPNQEK